MEGTNSSTPSFSYTLATINLNGISNANKINSLKSFIYALDLDIICMQEVINENLCIPGYQMLFNISETCRGTAIALRNGIEIINVFRSLDSRALCINLQHNVRILNIYAPSGSNNRSTRELFFNQDVPNYLQNHPTYTVLLGDFNSIVDPIDATGTSNMSPALKRLCERLNFKDVWREFHTQNDYTFVRGRSMSRIDRIYVTPNCLPNIRYCNLQVNSFSDHKAVVMRIVLPFRMQRSNRPFFRLNHQLLSDQNLNELRYKWAYWTRQRRNYTSWADWWSSYTKVKIASFFRWKNSIALQTFNNTMGFYYACLQNAYEQHKDRDCTTEINKIKSIMLQKQKAFSESRKNTNIRFLGGEDISVFQLADEANRRKETNISSLVVDGQSITNVDNIRSCLLEHYQHLFHEDEIEENERFFPARTIMENLEENNHLMDDFGADEIYEVIKGSAPNKSPGKDGLTREFYLKAWDIIKNEFTLVINEIKNGHVRDDLQDGVIVLVKKKGGDGSISSLRPITLLNVDYKILSRVLKQRTEKIATTILSSHQKCSNGNNTIFEAVCTVRDHIALSKHERNGGIVIACDLSSAFDRVSRSFVLSNMRRMGFNGQFVDLLANLSTKTNSQLIINGQITEAFSIKKSVRQGDPLSMLLFVIYLQPLLDNLAEICNGPGECVIAYADDITIVIRCPSKIPRIIACFQQFEKAAGAKLNMTKTEAMEIGAGMQHWDGFTKKDEIKILGVRFKNNIKDTIVTNWDKVYQNVNSLIWMNRPRLVNIKQKVVLLNTFICSKMWYMASILPMPNRYVGMFTKQIGFFLWAGVPAQRVRMTDVVRPRKEGGLGLHSPDLKTKALLVNRYIKTRAVLPSTDQYLHQIPAELIHLRTIKSVMDRLPQRILDSPEAVTIYQHLLDQLPAVKITEQANRNWKQVWENINNKRLTSDEKSTYFLLVHGKIPHNDMLFHQERRSDPDCGFCSERETLEHKFTLCQEVNQSWQIVKTVIEQIIQQPEISFRDLHYPILRGINSQTKAKILKTFIRYIMYHLEIPDESKNIDTLKSYLNMYA